MQTGGLDGIVNENSLRSAIARPYIGYYRTVFDKAAALIHGVVQNHGFADGNKRTAVLILGVFIQRSGYEITATEESMLEHITRVSTDEISFQDLRAWFQNVLIDR